MTDKWKAIAYAALAWASLGAGCVLGVEVPRLQAAFVAAGFVAYIAAGGRAISLWRWDERVFDHLHDHLLHRGPRNRSGRAGSGKLIAAVLLAVAVAAPMAGQQTIFNVPSADVLGPGKGYAEVGFASYRVSKVETRIEIGGWYSSAGFAAPHGTGGALATVEQPLPWVPGLTLAADWWSGENAIGYVSPGFPCAFGRWTAYAAYSIQNGEPRGNAGLIELGDAL